MGDLDYESINFCSKVRYTIVTAAAHLRKGAEAALDAIACLWQVILKLQEIRSDAMTQPKTDLAYLRSEKAKAEQKLRSCQWIQLQQLWYQ